jgi:predicted deacetylase
MTKYIIRLDDACPTMDKERWSRCEEILNEYDIKPVVAVIPSNIDTNLKINTADENFWEKVNGWQLKGWQIALHGFDHSYISNCSGILSINKTSEFAGVDINIQRKKIRAGLDIFLSKGITSNIWIAPSHTFDENTLDVLLAESKIRIISDSFAYYPYSKNGFLWIPQQLWKPKNKIFGVWTICLHPNMMTDSEFLHLDHFCKENKKKFINDIDCLAAKYRRRKLSILDNLYSLLLNTEFKIKRHRFYLIVRNFIKNHEFR